MGVVLPNTAWGRSNQDAINKAAAAGGATLAGFRWYNWGDRSLISQYEELRAGGAQAIILVANENEGAIFVKEVAAHQVSNRVLYAKEDPVEAAKAALDGVARHHGDGGMIVVPAHGDGAMVFNSEMMNCGWKSPKGSYVQS